MGKQRDLRMDNLRSLLIFLVVLCHLMIEMVVPRGQLVRTLYHTIYVFHMPVFVFITGYFARFKPSKILAGLLFPYVVFQLLAIAYANLVEGRAVLAGLTLVYPRWMLWYLLACVLWYCTIPALERVRSLRGQACVVAIAFVLSIAEGFVPWLGKLLALSRVVGFLPFFAIGFYAGRARASQQFDSLDSRKARVVRIACAVSLVAFLVIQALYGRIPNNALYRNLPFSNEGEFLGRILVQCGAVVWCAFLFVAMPTRDLGFASTVGRNTMSIYLLHSWVIRVLRYMPALPGGEIVQVLTCVVLDVATLVLLGNQRVGRAFTFVFGGGWLKR